MEIALNGSIIHVSESITIEVLLRDLSLSSDYVMVERNGEAVDRCDYSHTKLHRADRIELVRFVGGG